MPKQILIETRMGSLSLCESTKHTTRPGCLGTISGPCADYDHATRNNNFYSRKLWERVFNDPITKESLKDRVLIGELGHPAERLETEATNACIVMVGYEFHDDEGLLYGTFDILDTPQGRILKTLLDYGSKVGVSSRGEGDISSVTAEGINNIDEDTYEFVCFDAVLLPAVMKAKPALTESLHNEVNDSYKPLHESISKEIEMCNSVGELEIIRKVIKSTNMPEADSLLESVNNKSRKLIGEINSSSKNLIEDLEYANAQMQGLEEEIKQLKQSLITCKSQLSKKSKSLSKLKNENLQLQNNYEELDTKYSKLNSEYKELVFESLDSQRNLEVVSEMLDASNLEISNLKTTNSRLKESLSKSQNDSDNLKSKIVSLTTKLESYKSDTTKKLTESQNRSTKIENQLKDTRRQLKESMDEFSRVRDQYSKDKCRLYGVDYNSLIESFSKAKSFTEIDQIVNNEVSRMDRYRAVPIVEDKIINAIDTGTVKFNGSQIKVDEELERTREFMTEASKLF